MPDFSVGRSGRKLRFLSGWVKQALFPVENNRGWQFESWVRENPICYERYWTECFFKGKRMPSCPSAELCYNKYLNGTFTRNEKGGE